ncbi:MAG: PAS domain S-box protein [Desulfosarcinaceae bacterium]|nr:PAS domain S-box protein [Desulfosarcinaceae bacterium]
MLLPQQVNITRGLVLSFSVLMSIFLAFGLFTIYDISSISQLTRTIYNHPLVVSNAALQANVSITKMHRHMKDVVLFDSPIRILKAIEAVQMQEKSVYQHLDIVKERILGEEGKRLESQARQLFEAWRPIREEVIELTRSDQRQAAAVITIGKGASHVAALEKRMLGLTQYAREKASYFLSQAEKRRFRSRITSILFLVASFLAAALIIGFTLKRTASAEIALRESQQLLTSAIDRAPIGMVMVALEGRFMHANHAFCEMVGYTEAELQKMHFDDITHPEDREIGARIAANLNSGRVARERFEKRYLCRDGRIIHAIITTSLLRDQNEAPLFFFSQAQDITDRKDAETKLKESVERYRIVSEFTQDWEYWLGPEEEVLFISPSCERITGYAPSAFIEDPTLFTTIAHEADRERVAQHAHHHSEAETSEAQLDFRIVTKTGQIRWINHYCLPVFADDGAYLGRRSSNRDITDRKHSENQLRASEQRFRELFDNMSPGVAIYDSPDEGDSFIIRDLNRSGLEHSNTEKAKIVGKEVREVFPGIVEMGLFDIFQEVWRTGKPAQHPTSKYQDERLTLWVENYVCKLPSGELVAIYEDTTQKHLAEMDKKQLERQLFHAQKLESVGTLAGGIAHDFNNILASILGFTELALDDADSGTALESNLMEVYTAGKRARDLVKQILAFARQSGEERKPVQVSIIAKEALKLIRSTTPTSIAIDQQIHSNSLVMANPTQIHQILMNLCTNAVHAIENEEGTVSVHLKEVNLGDDHTAPLLELSPGPYLVLTVSDTGAGIPPNIMNAIFEPYFTTKEAGRGTGMGLAMVDGIVASYGGKITVESTPGHGTAFHIYLPITGRQEGSQHPIDAHLPTGTERILIVDDEPAVAQLGAQLLERLGYRVSFRTSSFEALELFRSRPTEFDLVISDMTMPNMTGDKLAVGMMEIRPELPVILCTGYNRRISEEMAREIGIKGFAYKPLVKADLARLVRSVLDGAHAVGFNRRGGLV